MHRFYRVVAQRPGRRDLVQFCEFTETAEMEKALARLEALPFITKATASRITEATFVRETGRA